MNRLLKTLVIIFSFAVLLSTMAPSVHAAAWIGHRFRLELPDGKTKELKGAKIHVFHEQHASKGADAFNNTCYYPDEEDSDSDWANKVKGQIGDKYFCATPSSCTMVDYGAPYLPIDFNENSEIYERDTASYKTFYGKTFTDALKGEAPFAYLAAKYEKGNIRGFAGAKWKGNVDYTEDEDDNERGNKVTMASKADIDKLNTNQYWGKSINERDAVQRWEEGEVYRDPLGGNVLHAEITWTLKAPAAPIAEKPSASLVGKCANSSPGVPSYTYTLSNIDLKGGTFKSSHLHLNVTKGAWTNEFKQQFGPPIYESTDANGIMSYSLIFTTTAPTNNTINWTVLPTEGVGNQASNTKTVADLVKWVDAKKTAGVTIPFEIKTNLEAEKDGQTVLNDSITVASNGFKPKFVTNECGQPTGGGGAPVCANIQLLDFGGNATTGDKLKAGDKVKFSCGQVTGATAYKFRVLELNSTGKIGKTVDLPPYPGRVSTDYTIPKSGTFMAQCAICTGANGTGCQAFEDTGLTSGTPDPVTPPAAGSGGACPFACVTNGGCNTSLGWKIESQYTCGTNQVCCNLQ